jgi:tripartite-type tricarboxylate transporter receptor subunit TctC
MQLFAVHIPHRGCTPAVTDTVAGHLDIVATSVPAGLPFLKQGRLRAIALMSSTRTPAAPEIPTIRESGIAALKDFYLDNYYGFMAPPGTPPAVAAKIGADIRRLAETPDVRKKLEGAGLDMLLLGPTEMMKLIRDDAAKYAAAARAADIKPE